MIRKKTETALIDDVLDQSCQELIIITKTKKLFLKPNLSLNDLSNEVGISVDEVKKILSEKLQVTFFEFISKYKVNLAKQLLTNTMGNQFSISSIAYKSGFNTDDSFATIFKQHTNFSPEEYRIKYFKIKSDSSAEREE